MQFPVRADTIERPGKSFLELLQKLVWIQQQLGVVIPLPEREFFSDEDVADILSIETVLRSGHFLGSCSDVTITFKPGAPLQLLKEHPDGIIGEMEMLQEYRHALLGTEVSLGPVELKSRRVRIDAGQLEELIKSAESGDIEEPAVRLAPEEGEFDARFKHWPKPSGLS